MYRIIKIAFLFFSPLALLGQSSQEFFHLGCSAYKNGNYAQAVEYFLESSKISPVAKTDYNLAITYDKLGEIGYAKVHYMRALSKEPRFREANANFKLFLKKYNLESPTQNYIDEFYSELSMNEWILITVVSFWLTIVALIIIPILQKKSGGKIFVSGIFLGLILLLFLILSSMAIYYWVSFSKTAIAIKDEAPLQISATEFSPIATTIKKGQSAKIIKQVSDFYLLDNLSGKRGWTRLNEPESSFKSISE